MNVVLHFFRKDLRFARWAILSTWFVAASVLWFPTVPLEERAEQIKWLYLSRHGSWLLLCLAAGHLILLDAPLREGAFIRTRPALLSDMLRSKCLTVLLLIVPMALFECLMLLLMGLRPGVLELTLVFAENFLILAAIAAVGMAMAIRQESARQFLSSIVAWGGVLFISWIAFNWCKSACLRTEKPEWSYSLEYLKSSRMLMAQFVALTGASISILRFVRSRRRETISRSLLATTACVIATLFFWPLNFVKTFVPPAREAPKNEWPDQSKLKAIIDPTAHSQSAFIKYSGSYNGVRYQSINSYFKIDGLSPDWFPAATNGYHSRIHLAAGPTIQRKRESWGSVHPTAVLHQLKMKPIYPVIGQREWQAELSEFKLESYAGSLSAARLSGVLLLPLYRAVILARAPLREGLSIHIPNRRIQIPKMEIIGDELHCTILEESSSISSRGGFTRLSEDSTAFLIIRKDRGEFVQSEAGGQTRSTAGHYSLRRTDLEGVIFQPNDKKAVTSDWLAGAEILIIGQEYGGTLSQPFDFSDVNLDSDR
jgi:arginine exporter protein ArgO